MPTPFLVTDQQDPGDMHAIAGRHDGSTTRRASRQKGEVCPGQGVHGPSDGDSPRNWHKTRALAQHSGKGRVGHLS